MKEGLGVEWLWQLPDTHPFHSAGVKHDQAYDLKLQSTSKEVDDIFLKECLEIAGSSLKLKTQAYFFYALARTWGFFRW